MSVIKHYWWYNSLIKINELIDCLYFHRALLDHGERGDCMGLDVSIHLDIYLTLKITYTVTLPVTFYLLLKKDNKK